MINSFPTRARNHQIMRPITLRLLIKFPFTEKWTVNTSLNHEFSMRIILVFLEYNRKDKNENLNCTTLKPRGWKSHRTLTFNNLENIFYGNFTLVENKLQMSFKCQIAEIDPSRSFLSSFLRFKTFSFIMPAHAHTNINVVRVKVKTAFRCVRVCVCVYPLLSTD